MSVMSVSYMHAAYPAVMRWVSMEVRRRVLTEALHFGLRLRLRRDGDYFTFQNRLPAVV
jgi:hypothetical protein